MGQCYSLLPKIIMSNFTVLAKDFLILTVCLLVHVNANRTYKLVHERAEIESWNKKYGKNLIFNFSKFNRTSFAVNASYYLLRDLGDDLEIHAQTYYFTSNEYRLYGIRLGINTCKAWKDDLFGFKTDFTKHTDTNFHGCNLTKGPYYIRNYLPDDSKFPSFLVNGKYKIQVSYMFKKNNLLVLNWYSVVEPLIA